MKGQVFFTDADPGVEDRETVNRGESCNTRTHSHNKLSGVTRRAAVEHPPLSCSGHTLGVRSYASRGRWSADEVASGGGKATTRFAKGSVRSSA
jgi:hypothetical protein